MTLDERLTSLDARLTALEQADDLAADRTHHHCWHDAQPDNFAYRVRYPVVCCHCGEQREYVTDAAVHGPYAPVSRQGRPV